MAQYGYIALQVITQDSLSIYVVILLNNTLSDHICQSKDYIIIHRFKICMRISLDKTMLFTGSQRRVFGCHINCVLLHGILS